MRRALGLSTDGRRIVPVDVKPLASGKAFQHGVSCVGDFRLRKERVILAVQRPVCLASQCSFSNQAFPSMHQVICILVKKQP
jgi:hypothetical protein